MITQSRFSELEQLLEQLKSDFEDNPENEYAWYTAYHNISELAMRDGSEKALLHFFDDWVEQGAHPVAYAARGSFLVGIAWQHRGGRFSSDTSAEAFVQMDHYLGLAKRAFDRALMLDPGLLPVHIQMISFGRWTSDRNLQEAYYSSGLKLAANSYLVRREYMAGFQPKWGGSVEQMSLYAEQVHGVVDINPRIWKLIGEPYAYTAGRLRREKDYETSFNFYGKALAYSQHPAWLSRRSLVAYQMRRYDSAIADIRRIAAYGRSVDHAEHLVRLIERESIEGRKRGHELAWYNFNIDMTR